jgi:acyl carrier protein
MGSDLDLGELMLEVEDAFAFSIPEEDVTGLSTMSKLYDYVLTHRFHGKQDECLTSMTFYRLRRALMAVLHIPRDAVHVATDLAALIPKHRRRTWRAIEKAAGFRLPFLQRPRWFARLAMLVAVAFGITIPLLLGITFLRGGILSAMFLTAAFVLIFFSRLTEFLATEFPPDVSTVGQLAKATLARNYRMIVAESKKSATDAEVWDMLQRIIAEQLGVQPDQLTKKTNFVKDYKLDLLGRGEVRS